MNEELKDLLEYLQKGNGEGMGLVLEHLIAELLGDRDRQERVVQDLIEHLEGLL